MSTPNQDFDKSETATPWKLEQARQRGTIGRSVEVTAATVFAVAVVWLDGRGWSSVMAQFRFDQALLTQAGQGALSEARLWLLLQSMVLDTLRLLAPLLVGLVLAALVGNLIQNRPNFTFKPLQPDWQRLNPVAGLKRLLSVRTLYEGARAVLKCGLLIAALWFALSDLARQFYAVAALPAAAYLHRLVDDVASLGLRVALLLGVLALIDLAWTRRRFARDMRMSRRELRDEVKHREGDPRIRARLRQLRLEALKRSLSIRRTGEGDVLITNPTHIAVSLRYRHGEMDAPLLVAKGAGLLAAAMRAIAARHHIPIVHSPVLARQLYRALEPGVSVPADLYAPVARILVWVLAMREAHGASRGGPSAASGSAGSARATGSTGATGATAFAPDLARGGQPA